MGNISRKTKETAYITLSEDIVKEVLKNIGGKLDPQNFKSKIKH